MRASNPQRRPSNPQRKQGRTKPTPLLTLRVTWMPRTIGSCVGDRSAGPCKTNTVGKLSHSLPLFSNRKGLPERHKLPWPKT